ncbi:prepilin peptidase [Candidatus Azambacteria bacterium]|nr:prepilin peptidase [Candidatus Azambacteria bacterium]
MDSAFVFLFGLAIGSFLNAAMYRLEVGGNIVSDRSRCPRCGHTLSWYELIPLLSFAIQQGRCRACRGPISWQYPLVELACGALFVLVWWRLPQYWHGGEAVYLFFVFASLLTIFVYDLKHYIIPNRVMYPLIAAALLHVWWSGGFVPAAHPVWSALGAGGFFLFLFLVSKGTWIGFGDVKYGLFMGLFLGFPLILVGFFFSYCIGALVSIFLLARKGMALASQIPFGPFLALGTAIAYFWGSDIIQWYLNIL